MNTLPRLQRRPELVAVWVSDHAMSRVSEHHEVRSRWDIVEMVGRAIEMPVEVVLGLLHRRHSAPGDRYFLADDRRGIFVLSPSRIPDSAFRYTLVTYLRFTINQTERVSALYPVEAA